MDSKSAINERSLEILKRVGHSNVVRALLFHARTWEPLVVNLTTPSYSPTSVEFLEDVMRYLNDPYAAEYQSTFQHINNPPLLGNVNSGQYAVIHSLIQRIATTDHEDTKNDRLSSMTGKGGIWYGNVLVLRIDGEELHPWLDAPSHENGILKRLEEYVREYHDKWLKKPATMALDLRHLIKIWCWNQFYGSQLQLYADIEKGLEDPLGSDGLDYINEIRHVRRELVE